MDEGGLLQQPAWFTFERSHGGEHIQAVALVVDGQPEEKWAQFGSEDPLGLAPLVEADAGGCMSPELPDAMQRPGHASVAIDQRQPPAKLLAEEVEEIWTAVELDQLHGQTGS